MLMKLSRASAVVLVACVGLFAGAADETLWMTDYAAAKAKAKAEKKLLLLDFTGSDWCGWCIKLHKEVFDLDAFKAEAPKKFVLVELDFPRTKELPPAVKAQNDKLQEEFKVQGFPTIYLADAEGRAVAKTGYQAGGAEKYIESLNGFVTSHEKLVALKGKLGESKGIERAKMLDEIIGLEAAQGLEATEDGAKYEAEILTLDADNKAGLKAKYTIKKLLAEAGELMGQSKFDEANAAFEKALATPGISATQKQDAYFAQGNLHFHKKDFSGVVASLTKAREAAPASPKVTQIDALLKRFTAIADAQGAVTKAKTAADAAKGVERAKALDEQVAAQTKFNTVMPSRTGPAEIEKLAQEIITLDADNKAGLKTKYESKALMGEAAKAYKAKEFDKAAAAVTKALALPGLTEEQKAPLLKMQKDLEAQTKADAPPAAK